MRKKHLTKLPDWFVHQNYEKFKKFTEDEIWEELNLRKLMLFQLFGYASSSGQFPNSRFKSRIYTSYDQLQNHIFSGNPLLAKAQKNEVNTKDTPSYSNVESNNHKPKNKFTHLTLSKSVCVSPLSIFDTTRLNDISVNFLSESVKSSDYHERNTAYGLSIDKVGQEAIPRDETLSKPRGINLNLNTIYFTDEQILEEIKRLLPIWRNEIKHPEIQIIKPRSDDLQKILNYEIFALCDLITWEFVNQSRIRKSVLVREIYKYIPRGEIELKQTIMPFLHKVFNPMYRRVDKK